MPEQDSRICPPGKAINSRVREKFRQSRSFTEASRARNYYDGIRGAGLTFIFPCL
ncbi:hypothetical protein HMPREF3038_03301 [Akkermansia sp. KLE1797]|nr:hypothetical protein HMPREF3038_03301 [Akkermansia sp. KLE1797]KXU55174.1 hypothetical protein HMPREF3039_00636 [Akkermansia sp. KLE1798]KZA03841.1 hypothetical protein HMPREF1326_02493 [Akkermansia sp. KLE1605]